MTTAPAPATERTVRSIPPVDRAAQLVPGTWNDATRTVEVVWTTGSRVRRYDYYNDTPYDEELVVTPESVDMSRFEAGAVSVLDTHSRWSLSSVIGIAERGWLDGNTGKALLRLSARPELDGVVADIKSGVIRNISAGYTVQRYEIVRALDRTDGINVPLYRATLWQPAEISFVPVGADADAGSRSATADSHHPHSRALVPCEFIRAQAQIPQERTMSTQDDTAQGANTNTDATRAAGQAAATAQAAASTAVASPAVEEVARAATRQEMERAATITDLCARHSVPQMAQALIRGGKTVQQAGLDILEERAKQDSHAGGHRNARVEHTADEQDVRLRGIEEALLHRVDPGTKLTDNGRQFRGMSLLELGRDYLDSVGVNTRGLDRMTLATRMLSHRSAGMHGTSDFSNLLANVASKRLRMAYEENPGTYKRWARRAPNAPDFKSMSVVQLSAMPDLLQVNEAGEFKYGVLRDGAEAYALLTYGRIVALTRQAVINDDLRSFDRLNTGFGAAAARLENRTAYAQITGNPVMSDSVALFHATHANLGTGAGSALQLSSLTAMRTAMRLQKGLQNEELNLVPTGLILPAALEQTGYQLTSSNYVPATQQAVSEFRAGGRTALEPVVEPILDAVSATAWYAYASNTQVDTVEYCYLDGAEGPVLESEMGFEVDGISLKARLDFAAKVIDFRGLYKSNGV